MPRYDEIPIAFRNSIVHELGGRRVVRTILINKAGSARVLLVAKIELPFLSKLSMHPSP